MKSEHVWVFPSKGLKAIFDEEIVGQLSDGAWENTMPYNHWEFWSRLKTEVGPKWSFKREGYGRPTKRTGYNLVGLTNPDIIDLSPRMRAYYVDAELGINVGRFIDYFFDNKGEIMTVDSIRKMLSGSDYYKTTLDKLESHPLGLNGILEVFGPAYKLYTRDALIKDLRLIKSEMKKVINLF